MVTILNDFDWVSGNYESEINIFGLQFTCVNQAYLYATVADESEKDLVFDLDFSNNKEISRFKSTHCLISLDDSQKVELMNVIQRAKFASSDTLSQELIDTGDKALIYISKSGFWGTDENFSGSNHLGNILAQIRQELNVVDHLFFSVEKEEEQEEDTVVDDIEVSTLLIEELECITDRTDLIDAVGQLVYDVESSIDDMDPEAGLLEALTKEEIVDMLYRSYYKFKENLDQIKEAL